MKNIVGRTIIWVLTELVSPEKIIQYQSKNTTRKEIFLGPIESITGTVFQKKNI